MKVDDALMMLVIFILIMLGMAVTLSGCAHSVRDYDLSGICALDFDSEKCWIEKKTGNGYRFSELKMQNAKWKKQRAQGLGSRVWGLGSESPIP